MTLDRRALLKGIGIGGASLTFPGVAAGDGETEYLVRIGASAARQRIRQRGYRVVEELADGDVLVVVADEESSDDLESIDDVEDAVPDFAFELEGPELKEDADLDGGGDGQGNGNGQGQGGGGSDDEDGGDGPAFFDLQWDKQVTEVRAAHDSADGSGTRLAIIDTGIDHTHPDLGNVNTELSTVFVNQGEQKDHTGDVLYHGTHVGGIAAGTGAEGVLGTAPGAELVSVRVFAEGELLAYFSDILRAIEYAAANGADAANMSIGTPPIPPQANAAQYRRVMEPVAQRTSAAGTLLVGSAGNSDANLQQGGYFTLPNSLAGVTSISATAPNDLRAFYSNYGTNEIDVGAPGGAYETLEKTLEEDEDAVEYPFPTNLVLNAVPGGWAWLAGTSMAAPQVTGTAGLVRDVDPDATAERVERVIKDGADLVEGDNDEELGAGRLNAADATDGAD
jgi:subtilisin family serine protease